MHSLFVMAGLVPAIHAFPHEEKTWMRGTSPRMTPVNDLKASDP